MKSLSVQFGKFKSSIREEGIRRAMTRLIFACASMVRPIPRGDVLVVSGGTGDSARYRSRHIAESLRYQGIRASASAQGSIFLPFQANHFRVFVFHRPIWNRRLEILFLRLKELGKVVVFDADDLTFDADIFRGTAAFESMNQSERKSYEQGLGKEFLDDPYVDVATASTPFLAERLSCLQKKTFVIRNRLSVRDVEIAENISASRAENAKDRVVIGYFSGTRSHDRDFGTVSGVLSQLLQEHRGLQLRLVGPLAVPQSLGAFSDRIERLPFASRRKHFENIAGVDINIAPLEIGDSFCESKSELKFFEAGIVRVPTVASATRTFRESIEDGVDGFVAMDEKEWREKLNRLISDAKLRRRMGCQAYETARIGYAADTARDDEYVNFLRKNI